MRIAIAHDLSRAEVRKRLDEKSHKIADHIPGGMAQVTAQWVGEDRLQIHINAMGQGLNGIVTIEDTQIIIDITLPMTLAFAEPAISAAIRQQGQKMLEA